MSGKPQDALIAFTMDGEDYAFHMVAESWQDAERRMQAIRLTGRVIGWPATIYRPNALTLPFIAAWVWLVGSVKNLLRIKP